MRWYEITAPSPEALGNVQKSLREQRLMVRSKDGSLFACISTNHQELLDQVCQDFEATLKMLKIAPKGLNAPRREEYVAPCGEKFYDPRLYSVHCGHCPKCREIKGAKVVAKLEPGKDLNGVISSLEAVRDQLKEKVEAVDNLLQNLKGFRDAKEKLTELSVEADRRIDAVRLLLRDNKL